MTCPYCNYQVLDNTKNCPYCGKLINGTTVNGYDNYLKNIDTFNNQKRREKIKQSDYSYSSYRINEKLRILENPDSLKKLTSKIIIICFLFMAVLFVVPPFISFINEIKTDTTTVILNEINEDFIVYSKDMNIRDSSDDRFILLMEKQIPSSGVVIYDENNINITLTEFKFSEFDSDNLSRRFKISTTVSRPDCYAVVFSDLIINGITEETFSEVSSDLKYDYVTSITICQHELDSINTVELAGTIIDINTMQDLPFQILIYKGKNS